MVHKKNKMGSKEFMNQGVCRWDSVLKVVTKKICYLFNILMIIFKKSWIFQSKTSFQESHLELSQTTGTHEIQVSEGGEADLHTHYNSCKKNPGHKRFVPVNDFKIKHMPKGYHDNDLVQFIKATAALTVRVSVQMTSTDRPEFLPNTKVPYAFHDKRGSDALRTGTGKVWDVDTWRKKDKKGTCKCLKCKKSKTPSKEWGKVWMFTATHVVFDDLEAKHTKCRLFYDREDSRLITLRGWKMVNADIEKDMCKLECVTCNVTLLDLLDRMARHWCDLWDHVNYKYESSSDRDKLIFIVSHPHGCSKQISVGQWISRFKVREGSTKYTYTTCTCPGSSGAYVHPLRYNPWLYYDHHVHGGVNFEGTNYSGTGRDLN